MCIRDSPNCWKLLPHLTSRPDSGSGTITCAPLFNSTIYHTIVCPQSGTIATGETITSNGIPLGNAFLENRRHDTLWYAIPESGNFSDLNNFYVLPYDEQNIKPGSNWVLLAMRCNETNGLKWIPGNVVISIPEQFHEIKWGSNYQHFGRDPTKTTIINGMAGAITAPTINATNALQVSGVNINTIYQPIGNYLQTSTFNTYSNNVNNTFTTVFNTVNNNSITINSIFNIINFSILICICI